MVGIRERKLAATRQRISDEATRLFERQGFEQVSLAQVAEAADVSLKTVVNHFGAKEDLFFDAEPAILDAMIAAVEGRGAATSTAALRPLILDGALVGGCPWDEISDSVWRGMRTWSECEVKSPTLTTRRAAILQSWMTPLARSSGSPAWAAMLTGLLCLRHTLLQESLLRSTPAEAERRIRDTLDPGLRMLDSAFR